MPEYAIEVEGLSKWYGQVQAVKGIRFTVAQGATCALLGANGAGKTTTLAILLGFLTPMNFSSPYVDLPQRLTVAENLTVYARLYGVSKPKQRIAQLGEDLEFTPFMQRPYRTLSAGQKTRVMLAKALLNRPELILLDEPTASLDPDSADRVRQYLCSYQRQSSATVLLASHNMTEVERIGTEVLMMRAGHIVDQGAPSALIAKYGRTTMEDVFLDIARNDGVAEETLARRAAV